MNFFDKVKDKFSSNKNDIKVVEDKEIESQIPNIEEESIDEIDDFELPPDFKTLELPENFSELEAKLSYKDETSIDEDELEKLESDTLDESESLDFVSHVSVYDNVSKNIDTDVNEYKDKSKIDIKLPGLSDEENIKLLNKVNSVPSKLLKTILASILGATIVFGGILIITNNIINKKAEAKSANFIKQPISSSNNTNYIYSGVKKVLDDQEIVISKIAVDSLGTVFYLKNELDVSKYNFSLTDNNDNIYLMDLSFTDTYKAGKSKALYFQALKDDIKKFNLNIYDLENNKYVDFPFQFDSGFAKSPAVFLREDRDDAVKSNNLDIQIYGGEFSSSSSKIFYSINDKNIVYDENSTSSQITLKDSFGYVKPIKTLPNIYSFEEDNQEFQRFDFAPVTNLKGKIDFTFNDLYKKINVNEEIDVLGLSEDKLENQVVLKAEEYNIVLERFIKQGDYYILVAHSENTLINENNEVPEDETKKPKRITIPPTYSGKVEEKEPIVTKKPKTTDETDPYYNRVKMDIDAQLIGITFDGKEVIIQGKSGSIDKGSDILFPLEMLEGTYVPLGNIKIKINNATFKLPPQEITFDLSAESNKLPAKVQIAKDAVLGAFTSRLSFKSNEISVSNIVGFSRELLDNKTLMGAYVPQVNAVNPSYNVNIVSYKIIDHEIYAIVSEVWKGEVEGSETYFYRNHKVKAKDNGEVYTVYYDEIINN